MDYVIYFAITIGILVFIHEFGHFIAAKSCGMRAEVFAIGFGKRLFGWNKINGFTFGDLPKDFDGGDHTDYRLSLLPLGGYVKIAGMVDESFDTEFADKAPEPYEFRARPVYQKVIVITAGVAMNLLLAVVVFWGANFFQGKQIVKTTTIGYVEPASKADSAGFKTDDRILAVNGVNVTNWEEVGSEIFINTLGEDLTVKLERDGKTKVLNIPRTRIPDGGKRSFLIPTGIRAQVGDVLKDSPALKAGVKSGDILLSINNIPLYSAEETIKVVGENKNKTVPLNVLRGKDTLNLSVTPSSEGLIGIQIGQTFTGPVEYKTFGFFESFARGWDQVVYLTDLTFTMVNKVIGGKIAFGKAFGGPVKIAEFAAQSAETGIATFLNFLAYLSLTLAIINILPFPVLDGGHLVIILLEGAFKREIPIKIKIAIQNVGFVILMLLMAFIIYNDLINL